MISDVIYKQKMREILMLTNSNMKAEAVSLIYDRIANRFIMADFLGACEEMMEYDGRISYPVLLKALQKQKTRRLNAEEEALRRSSTEKSVREGSLSPEIQAILRDLKSGKIKSNSRTHLKSNAILIRKNGSKEDVMIDFGDERFQRAVTHETITRDGQSVLQAYLDTSIIPVKIIDRRAPEPAGEEEFIPELDLPAGNE